MSLVRARKQHLPAFSAFLEIIGHTWVLCLSKGGEHTPNNLREVVLLGFAADSKGCPHTVVASDEIKQRPALGLHCEVVE